MLTIAPSAAEAVASIVASNGLPDTGGLRLALASNDSTGAQIVLQLADAPAPDDEVVDEGDAHVFVDAGLADALSAHTLEASVDEDHVDFALTGPQE